MNKIKTIDGKEFEPTNEGLQKAIDSIHIMDDDLEDILNEMWEKKPYPTIDYYKVKATLLLVQELRNIKKPGVIV